MFVLPPSVVRAEIRGLWAGEGCCRRTERWPQLYTMARFVEEAFTATPRKAESAAQRWPRVPEFPMTNRKIRTGRLQGRPASKLIIMSRRLRQSGRKLEGSLFGAGAESSGT